MSFSSNFRLATFEYDNNPLQTLDFPIKNERDITSSLSSGGSPFYPLYMLIPFNFGLLWSFCFSNNLINLVFISVLVPKWYLKIKSRLISALIYINLSISSIVYALTFAFIALLLTNGSFTIKQ